MKHNQDKINNLSKKEAYDIYLPVLSIVYSEYDILNLKEEEKNIIFNKVLKEFVYLKDRDVSFIERRLRSGFNKLIEKRVNEGDTLFLSDFLSLKVSFSNKYDKIISQFDKLEREIAELDILNDSSQLIDLLQINKKIYKAVEVVFNKNSESIKNGKLYDIFNNRTLCVLLNAYIVINDIEIKQEEEFDFSTITANDDVYIEDTFKNYIYNICSKRLLSREEEYVLAKRAKNGDKEAFDTLIEHNLKLVIKYAKNRIGYGLDLLDLIQEGNIGLIKALNKYDPDKGYKFSTYATFWVQQAVNRSVQDSGRTIRIPVHISEVLGKMKYHIVQFRTENGKDITDEELANKLHISVTKVKSYRELDKDIASLDTLVGESEDNTLSDLIPSADVLEDRIIEEKFKEEFLEFIKSANLKPNLYAVLKYRFGLDGESKKTLIEVGDMLGISKERVRQLQNKAINILRTKKDIKNYIDYLDNPDAVYDELVVLKEKDRTTKLISNNKYITFYDLFGKYKKEDIKYYYNFLTDNEKSVIAKRFGDDLDVYYFDRITVGEVNLINNIIIPKIKEFIEESNNIYSNNYNIYKELKEYIKSDQFKNYNMIFTYIESLFLSLISGNVSNKKFTMHEANKILKIYDDSVLESISTRSEDYKETESFKKLMLNLNV